MIWQLSNMKISSLWHQCKYIIIQCGTVIKLLKSSNCQFHRQASRRFCERFRLSFDGLVQERRNSGALAMELCLSCTNPPILPLLLHNRIQLHLAGWQHNRQHNRYIIVDTYTGFWYGVCLVIHKSSPASYIIIIRCQPVHRQVGLRWCRPTPSCNISVPYLLRQNGFSRNKNGIATTSISSVTRRVMMRSPQAIPIITPAMDTTYSWQLRRVYPYNA